SRSLKWDRHRLAQLAAKRLQALARAPVGIRLLRIGVDDQIDLPREVVDDGELFGEHEEDVGNFGEAGDRGRRSACELRLDVPHGVVTEVAGEPTAEPREAG